jgi:hypothetical protein
MSYKGVIDHPALQDIHSSTYSIGDSLVDMEVDDIAELIHTVIKKNATDTKLK